MTELKRRSEADHLRYILQKIAEFPDVSEKAAQQMQLMAKGALGIGIDAHAQRVLSEDDIEKAAIALHRSVWNHTSPWEYENPKLKDHYRAQVVLVINTLPTVTSTDGCGARKRVRELFASNPALLHEAVCNNTIPGALNVTWADLATLTSTDRT